VPAADGPGKNHGAADRIGILWRAFFCKAWGEDSPAPFDKQEESDGKSGRRKNSGFDKKECCQAPPFHDLLPVRTLPRRNMYRFVELGPAKFIAGF
jgi:hypothetical protein